MLRNEQGQILTSEVNPSRHQKSSGAAFKMLDTVSA
jgi:hypothetical protein